MSHNRHNKSDKYIGFEGVFYRFLLVILAGFLLFFGANAGAATNSGTKLGKNPSKILKTTLSELSGQELAILDWKTQSFEVNFDLPSDGWYENMDLFLTVIPDGMVSTTAPVTVSYNGEKPIPLHGQSSRFDAHIRLDPARIRTARNSLIFSYKTPHKTDCLTAAHGQWIVDLSKSKLSTMTRAKPRRLKISEIETRLSHPMTAPKRVAIRAVGDNKFGLEALAAQGMAARMTTLPAFQFSPNNSDFELVVGTRDEIRSMVRDKDMLTSQQSRLFIDSAPRPRLVLTGTTEAQVTELVRNFATHRLPLARRVSVSSHEFLIAPKFSPTTIIDDGKYTLSDIGDTTILPSWRPRPAELAFNVANAASAQGELILNISAGDNIDPASKLKVKLNNQSIGFTHLDKNKKFVSFDIKPGQFKAAGNTLRIEPSLVTPETTEICNSFQTMPGLLVSHRSKLDIDNDNSGELSDLNRFAASGAPLFNSDSDTTIVLTARTSQDRAASLRFVAFAAQQFGPKLAQADYVTELDAANKANENLLIIGPNAMTDPALVAASPSAMKLALRGKPTTGPNTLQVASLDTYASTDGLTTRTAQQLGRNARIQGGGIASLFVSPYNANRVVGVITADRPSRFSTAMTSLTKPGYWNGLQGSVARWNTNTIMMAQTSLPLPNLTAPKATTTNWQGKLSAAATKSKDWIGSFIPKRNAPAPVTTPQPIVKVEKQPILKLRGAVNADQFETRKPMKNPFANLRMPSADKLQTGTQEKFAALNASVKNIQSNGMDWRPVKTWAHARTQDRNTILFIIILSLFLMLGLAIPKQATDK